MLSLLKNTNIRRAILASPIFLIASLSMADVIQASGVVNPSVLALNRLQNSDEPLLLRYKPDKVELLAQQAQQDSGLKIYNTITLSDLERVLDSSDILYKRETDNFLRFSGGDYKIGAILQLCKSNSTIDCKSVLLQVRFRLSGSPDLKSVNDWNRTVRGSRAYIDTNGAVVLESDLDVFGGVSSDNLKMQILRFVVSTQAFAKHIGFQ